MSNGYGTHTNGSLGHAESSSSADSFDDEKDEGSATSNYAPNGYSQCVIHVFGLCVIKLFFARLPLQSHNDELVGYLYHSGFQTGVRDA